MEYKILSGNNLAESSAKADENDQIMEVLEKYGTGKEDNRLLTKENAKEACTEVWSQKKGVDSYEAMDVVNNAFSKAWKLHDVLHKNVIDFAEGYQLVQDMLREWLNI